MALMLMLMLPRVASAEAPQREGARVRVVVEAKELGDAGVPIIEAAAPSLRAAVEAAGYALEDSVEAEATVRVRITYFNADDRDFQVHVEISAGAEMVRLESVGCPNCADEALVAVIEGQRDEILAALERTSSRAEEPQQQPQQVEPENEPIAPTPAPKPIGVLGGVGIGVAVLGVGAIIGGGVELARGKVYDDVSRTRWDRTFVDHRPAGGALLGVGGVLLAAGVTMLVVDIVHSKKRREHAMAVPLLGPSMVGLGYTGQF